MNYKPGQMWKHKPDLPVQTVMIVSVMRGIVGVDTTDGYREFPETTFLHEFELGWDVDDLPRTTWDRLLITEDEL